MKTIPGEVIILAPEYEVDVNPFEKLRLERIATQIRDLAMDNITKANVGHPGGSLSITDILTTLYFGRIYSDREQKLESILRVNPKDPLWEGRDRVILSKGHA